MPPQDIDHFWTLKVENDQKWTITEMSLKKRKGRGETPNTSANFEYFCATKLFVS